MAVPRKDPHRLAIKAYAEGDFATAARLCARILEQIPGDFNALHLLGLIRAGEKKFAPAERLLAKALQYGRSPEALGNYGNVLSELGRHDDALRHLRHALLLQPASAIGQFNLANALKRAGRASEALHAYAEALAVDPKFAHAMQNYGELLREMGRAGEAAAQFRAACHISPKDVSLRNALGLALQEAGQMDAARAAFDEAIEQNPSATAAYFHRVKLDKIGPDDPILARMEALRRDNRDTSEESRAMLGFALAKAHDDIGRFDEAFARLLEANRLTRASVAFDEATIQRQFSRLKHAFTVDLFARRQGQGSSSTVPIFIVGFPRSGTTLAEQILASHPRIHGGGENSLLEELAMTPMLRIDGPSAGERLGFPESLSLLAAERLHATGDRYAEQLQRLAPAAVHITDKLPLNFMFIGLIRLILPHARIIHARRDPLDTCLSCFAQYFRSGNVEFSYDLEELGRSYRRYLDLMAHWRRVLPADSFLEVDYEKLVDDLEGEARRLIDHCGLPWDDSCLMFHRNQRSVRTASVNQVRQPIYRSSVARWRNYEGHLQPLIAALKG